MSLAARSEYALHQLVKRKNWAQREPGVIVVFIIVFLVAILVIAMFINKRVRPSTLPDLALAATNLPHRGKPPRSVSLHLKISPSRVEPSRIADENEKVALCRSIVGGKFSPRPALRGGSMCMGKSLYKACEHLRWVFKVDVPFRIVLWNGYLERRGRGNNEQSDTSMSIHSQISVSQFPSFANSVKAPRRACRCISQLSQTRSIFVLTPQSSVSRKQLLRSNIYSSCLIGIRLVSVLRAAY